MYPTVGARPIAAVNAASGVSATAASARPRRPPPRPARPAAARPACAGGFWGAAAADGAAAGVVGVRAARTGFRSSSVDQRRIWILTGAPDWLTLTDVAVRLISPVLGGFVCADLA